MKLSPFLQGLASIVDIFGVTHPRGLSRKFRESAKKSPSDAFAEDWAAVTKDFEAARQKVVQKSDNL
jgi:hypothetical protein